MHFKKSFLFLTVLFFVACGGGGGSEKPIPTENPPSTENPDASTKKEVPMILYPLKVV